MPDKRKNYDLGVQRTIKSKRGTGTRDEDEIKTTYRAETLDELEVDEERVMDSHRDALKDARSIGVDGDKRND